MSIQVLQESVAKKIAAGEVIDRPCSVVRELLDNSLDAGASSIEVHITDGGKQSIRVVDNGSGMSKEDLQLCTLSHATSKIRHEDDLLSVSSLGFRGEALASISAVAKVTLQSRTPDAKNGYILYRDISDTTEVRPAPCPIGTIIEVRDLFYNLPARRHFVKQAAAETGLIRRTLTDKAAAYPDVEFKLYVDSKLNTHSVPESRIDRIRNLYSNAAPANLWYSVSANRQGFSLTFVGVKPDMYRRDRRYLQVFVNKRRVSEFALQQAIEYSYSDYIPGGNYPVGFIFIDIEPNLVDFNIHPAKKEIRFRNKGELHHQIVVMLQSTLKGHSISVRKKADHTVSYDLDFPKRNHSQRTVQYDLHTQFIPPDTKNTVVYENPHDTRTRMDYRYIGQLFDVFLLVESDERFFMIDMHAGHERLQYDIFRNAHSVQQLMIPISFTVSDSRNTYLQQNETVLSELGISLKACGQLSWELTGVPETFAGDPHKLIPFLAGEQGYSSQLAVFLYATLACRSAVKEGERLLPEQANAIIKGVFQLDDARCPHGRPIWIEFDRRTLYKMVGRE